MFIFICTVALIIARQNLSTKQNIDSSKSTSFAFAQKISGRGVINRGDGKDRRFSGSYSGPSQDCGLVVTTIDQLNTILNTIGFKLTRNMGDSNFPPPLLGVNMDEILKQLMTSK